MLLYAPNIIGCVRLALIAAAFAFWSVATARGGLWWAVTQLVVGAWVPQHTQGQDPFSAPRFCAVLGVGYRAWRIQAPPSPPRAM